MVIRHNPQVNFTEVFSAPSKSRELISNPPDESWNAVNGLLNKGRRAVRAVPSKAALLASPGRLQAGFANSV